MKSLKNLESGLKTPWISPRRQAGDRRKNTISQPRNCHFSQAGAMPTLAWACAGQENTEMPQQ